MSYHPRSRPWPRCSWAWPRSPSSLRSPSCSAAARAAACGRRGGNSGGGTAVGDFLMGPDNASLASRTAPPVAARTAGSQYDLDMISVSKSYGGPDVVSDVTFTLRHGEFLTLLGPSGSGKTTTLLMVAGFEHPTAGDIRVGGGSIVDDPPQRRNLGIVYQSYALFPHMSVLDNVEFPLRMRGVAKPVRRARAAEMLDRVGLRGFGARRPRQLSGGQQQRVALVRALVFEPTALLLDV